VTFHWLKRGIETNQAKKEDKTLIREEIKCDRKGCNYIPTVSWEGFMERLDTKPMGLDLVFIGGG
jgi:hypothetical protein